MTWPQTQEFAKYVVLKYLKQIVAAEEKGTYVPEISQIARGLPFFDSVNFVSILRHEYNVAVSI